VSKNKRGELSYDAHHTDTLDRASRVCINVGRTPTCVALRNCDWQPPTTPRCGARANIM